MKKLISTMLVLCLILSSSVIAKELVIENTNFFQSKIGQLEFEQRELVEGAGNYILYPKERVGYSYSQLNSLFIARISDKLSLKTGVQFLYATNDYKEKGSHNGPNDYNAINVQDFNFNYYLTNDDVITVGVIDFSRGKNSEFIDTIESNSPFIHSIAQGRLEGIFYSHYTDSTDTKIGYSKVGLFGGEHGFLNEEVPEAADFHENLGSETYFFALDYYPNDEWTFTLNYLYNSVYMLPSSILNVFKLPNDYDYFEDVGEVHTIGLNVQYKNENFAVYANVNRSKTHMDTTQFSPTGEDFRLNDVRMLDITDTGYLYLIGAQAYLDVPYINREAQIGFEGYHTTNGYFTHNNGGANRNFSAEMLGNAYTVYTKIDVSKNLNVGLFLSQQLIDYSYTLLSTEKVPLERKNTKTYINIVYQF